AGFAGAVTPQELHARAQVPIQVANSTEAAMRVSDCMTRDVRIVSASESIRDAAQMMCECDTGVLPVGENDRLVGMITDRDIAIRAVGKGKGPDTKVRDVMSAEVRY